MSDTMPARIDPRHLEMDCSPTEGSRVATILQTGKYIGVIISLYGAGYSLSYFGDAVCHSVLDWSWKMPNRFFALMLLSNEFYNTARMHTPF